MPFEVGNQDHAKRQVRRGGRPLKAKREAAQIVKDILSANAEKLSRQYIKRALDKYGDRVLCHAIDKLLPDDRNATAQPTAIIHQFIQFGTGDPNTIQLSAEGVSAPVLVGDGGGQEEGGEVLASEVGQGQNGLEFHSFTHVSRK
jgi:hypothetical protein